MNFHEEAACFHAAGVQHTGILARPERPAATGVLVLVGGAQYRVGSHRQFVLLSRALAAAGFAVLRFDFAGMGDSEGGPHDFQSASATIGAALLALQALVPGVAEVVLWGLCDAAAAALLYCFDTPDAPVSRLCLANPWIDKASSQAAVQVRHYYRERLRSAAFWRKLLRGGIGRAALAELARTLGMLLRAGRAHAAPPGFQERMASAWLAFPGPILLLLSDNDYIARAFLHHVRHDPAWKNALRQPGLLCHTLRGADHTFSSAAQRAQVAELTLRYGLGANCGRPPRAT